MNQFNSKQNNSEIAETFWKKAGGINTWPCDLEQAVAFTMPLDLIHLSNLSIQRIEGWFKKRNIEFELLPPTNRLHGCLIAYKGVGFIFIDGSDLKEERFYTLAHEVSHFIIEYLIPRFKASELFGDGIYDVLDGIRPPSIDESIGSIINSISIQPHVHLLEHPEGSSSSRFHVWQIENRADQLALELIAPYKNVYHDLKRSNVQSSYNKCFELSKKLLIEKYGLPLLISENYARHISKSITGGPSVLSSLGLE